MTPDICHLKMNLFDVLQTGEGKDQGVCNLVERESIDLWSDTADI